MEQFNIYIKTALSIDDIATIFRKVSNIATENVTSHQSQQKRHGVNYGGDYYFFESLGMEFYLVQNEGEMLEDEFEEYRYYFILHVNEFSLKGFSLSIATYISFLLNSNSLESMVGSM